MRACLPGKSKRVPDCYYPGAEGFECVIQIFDFYHVVKYPFGKLLIATGCYDIRISGNFDIFFGVILIRCYYVRMIAISLNSGSNGNCIYVEAGGKKLLFDAGISGKRAKERLEGHRRDIRDVDGLIISHDHRDHIASAGVYQRKFGMPMYITQKTLDASHERCGLGKLGDVEYFDAGSTIKIGDDVKVHTVPTTHDAAEGCGFVVEAEGKRLGILTDLGDVFDGLPGVIVSLDAAILESNYDPTMLQKGPYPYFLKERISGPNGHISNIQAAELVADYGRSMQWVCLAHLSQENNSHDVALATHRDVCGDKMVLHLASRFEAGPVMEVC